MTSTFTLLLAVLAIVLTHAAVIDPKATGTNVVVCTIPQCANLQQLSNLARGITFTTCHPTPPPAGAQFAYASISPDSGFQQQLYDMGPDQVDGYWIEHYLEPLTRCDQLHKVRIECWQTPKAGCAREPKKPAPPVAAVPASDIPSTHIVGRLAEPQPAPVADSTSDTDLFPLPDASLRRKK